MCQIYQAQDVWGSLRPCPRDTLPACTAHWGSRGTKGDALEGCPSLSPSAQSQGCTQRVGRYSLLLLSLLQASHLTQEPLLILALPLISYNHEQDSTTLALSFSI